MSSTRLLSVVVPVHDECDGIDVFYERIKAVLDGLPSLSHEILFVDDGSGDGSCVQLETLAGKDSRVRLVKLSRRFGHQIAITAGVDVARGDAVVVIDADLQDPPELIGALVKKWEEGHDVVYGVREKRDGETALKTWTASLYYRLLKSMTGISIPVDVGDYRLISRRVVDQLRAIRETDRFVRGLVSWVGFKQVGVPYARDRRHAGNTKYRYPRMVKFALDGITSFSSAPLAIAWVLGFLISGLSLLCLCVVLAYKIMEHSVPGWLIVMVSVLLIGGVQLICLGIVGEYIGRILNEGKGRPLYVIDEIRGAGSPAPERLVAETPDPGTAGGAARSLTVRRRGRGTA